MCWCLLQKMGRVIVMNPDGDLDKDRNMVQHLLGQLLTG